MRAARIGSWAGSATLDPPSASDECGPRVVLDVAPRYVASLALSSVSTPCASLSARAGAGSPRKPGRCCNRAARPSRRQSSGRQRSLQSRRSASCRCCKHGDGAHRPSAAPETQRMAHIRQIPTPRALTLRSPADVCARDSAITRRRRSGRGSPLEPQPRRVLQSGGAALLGAGSKPRD